MREKAVNTKITHDEMLKLLQPGNILLSPLVIRTVELETNLGEKQVDAVIELSLPGEENNLFCFVVEAKSRATLESIYAAIAKAREGLRVNEWPMIFVPYLAPDRLTYLEREGVSGFDLCGNGVVVIPNRLYVIRTGQPNNYPDSRPLNNPYRGRSAMVARMLIEEPSWSSLTSLVHSIEKAGVSLSLSQASKATRALEEDMFILKLGGTIKLQDRIRLLDKLGSEWGKPQFRSRKALRLKDNVIDWASRLSSRTDLQWAMSGESSASRYVVFSQGGPRRIVVSDLSLAATLIGGAPESLPSFADVELLETEEPGFFFQTIVDENGMRWANRLQTWLELQAGDARQKEAAKNVRRQILGSREDDN
jgi:hypothetical protein